METLISGSFTCITCHVVFKDADMQRSHYKADWHRYNLKRKVAELPPVSAEDFQSKVHNQRNLTTLSQQDKGVYCQVCRKSFSNQNAFDNHLNSKKHKDNVAQGDGAEIAPKPREKVSESKADNDEPDVEEVDSDDWEDGNDNPLDNNDCIFCLHHSHNFMKNLEHMTVAHSFFIPDIEFCVDIEGLMHYLGEKVASGFMCLWCNEKGRTFHTAEAARNHMMDKGHCRMLHEELALAEYVDFYDYSSSYPDAEEGANEDEEVTLPELDGSDYQLVLPSGAVIGHRSLMRYYRQNFNPNSAVVLSKNNNSKKLHSVLAQYRSLGWTATQQEAAARKARDLHYLKRMQAKFNVKLGVKANKLQTHFRRQVNF